MRLRLRQKESDSKKGGKEKSEQRQKEIAFDAHEKHLTAVCRQKQHLEPERLRPFRYLVQ
jgi:hypothetical protein